MTIEEHAEQLVERKSVMLSICKEYNRRRTGDGLRLAWIEKAVDDTPSANVWKDPEKELPTDTNFVLALISGRIGSGTYDHAPAIVEYWDDEGWYLTDIDYNEQKDYWHVDAWMPIPAYEEAEE